MNKKTLEALKASIQHWRENEAAETVDFVSVWAAECALCSLFMHAACNGCPVAKKTGKKDCFGSPWFNAYNALQEWRRHPGSTHARDAFRIVGTSAAQRGMQ